MDLSELENQLLELQIIKNKAIKEYNYETAARQRDKIKALLELFKQTNVNFDENALIAVEEGVFLKSK
jgi:excinuclease UvrABC nuclease subunit